MEKNMVAYAIVHNGALVRQQGGSNLPLWFFSSRKKAEEFAREWLADGSWQVVVA